MRSNPPTYVCVWKQINNNNNNNNLKKQQKTRKTTKNNKNNKNNNNKKKAPHHRRTCSSSPVIRPATRTHVNKMYFYDFRIKIPSMLTIVIASDNIANFIAWS
jgi:hypothetical protein